MGIRGNLSVGLLHYIWNNRYHHIQQEDTWLMMHKEVP